MNDEKSLRSLLTAFLEGSIATAEFCDAFEHAYNFEVDRAQLGATEAQAFADLFDDVVYYSPHPDERAMIPNYRSDAEIEQAAKRAVELLSVKRD